MSDEQLRSLFNLTGTITMPGTSEEKGTGLGLILCKEFMDMHQGKIWAESELKKGSVFFISLPAES